MRTRLIFLENRLLLMSGRGIKFRLFPCKHGKPELSPLELQKAPVLTKGRGRNLVVPPFFTVCSHKLPFKYTHPVKTIQSICEYSDKITAAAPLQSTFAKSQVRCRAQRGIPYKLPLRLSPAGYSLLASLISTCSPQR